MELNRGFTEGETLVLFPRKPGKWYPDLTGEDVAILVWTLSAENDATIRARRNGRIRLTQDGGLA